MATFAEILTTIRGIEDADRESLKALAAKYPDLDKVVARKTDLDTATTRAAELQSELDAAAIKVSGWETWREQNWVPGENGTDGMTKGHKAALNELQVAKYRLTQLDAGLVPGGDMTFDEIAKQLDTAGYAKKTDLATLAAKDDLKPLEQRVANQQSYFENFYRNTAHLPVKFDRLLGRELNEDFDMAGFIQFCTTGDDATVKDRLTNTGKAFDDFIAPKKQALEFKQKQDKLTADQAKLEADRTALETARTSAPNPSDGGSGPAAGMGHFQKRIMEGPPKAGDAAVDNLPLGKGLIARAAGEELRANGTLIQKEVVQ